MEFSLQIKQELKFKMVKKFLRRTWHKYSKLGKGRKKKQIWRRPTGRDNKMREKRKGYPAVVSIGYKKDQNDSGKIKEKIPVMIKNVNEMGNLNKNQIALIGNVGKKRKIELAEFAQKNQIDIYNLNPKIYLKKNKKVGEKSKEIKTK